MTGKPQVEYQRQIEVSHLVVFTDHQLVAAGCCPPVDRTQTVTLAVFSQEMKFVVERTAAGPLLLDQLIGIKLLAMPVRRQSANPWMHQNFSRTTHDIRPLNQAQRKAGQQSDGSASIAAAPLQP